MPILSPNPPQIWLCRALTVAGVTAVSPTALTVLAPPTITGVTPAFALQGAAVPTVTVSGTNLTGASFVFQPAGLPAALAISNVIINAAGTSATMTVTPLASAVGTYALVATTGNGASIAAAGPANSFSILSNSPSADTDGDGLPDVVEALLGSNPLVASSSGTGIPDGWAVYFGLSPTDPTIGSKVAPNGLTYLQSYQRGLNPVIASLTPPTVSNVIPGIGASGVATNSSIAVRFSTPIQSGVSVASAQSALTAILPLTSNLSASGLGAAAQVLQGFLQRTCCGSSVISGVIQVLQNGRILPGAVYPSNDQLSVTFTPAQPFSSATQYTVSVQGVRGISGVVMAQPYIWSFTSGLGPDGNNPVVVATSPHSGLVNVPVNSPIRVRFSKPMDPASITPASFSVVDTTTGLTVPGNVQVDATGLTAAFVATPALKVSRTISVALSTSLIHDLQGNPLVATGTSFSFGTADGADNVGPQLKAISPPAAMSNVPTNVVVQAEFDRPIDWLSAIDGVRVLNGTTPVPGVVALSEGDRRVSFTPATALAPSTTYGITVSTQVRDLAGLPLAAQGGSTFVTGIGPDTTTPTISGTFPTGIGVPVNSTVQIQFSKPVDPATVMALGAVSVTEAVAPGVQLAGALSLSADARTVTFRPALSLASGTTFNVAVSGITDLVGNAAPAASWSFTTGASSQASGFHVVSTVPAATTGVPLNSVIEVVLSAPIDPLSVATNSVTITSSAGGVVPGNTTVAADGMTLHFVPGVIFAPNTTYTAQVGAITDFAGNAASAYSWNFSTGTTAVVAGGLSVVTWSPGSGSTGVSPTAPVVITFSSAVDPATVNAGTVFVQDLTAQFSSYGQGCCVPVKIPATITVNGNVVTLTPVTAWPGSATLQIAVAWTVTDLAGNSSIATGGYATSNFVTAVSTSSVTPTVTSVTPANGATGVGLNQQVILTFNDSIAPTAGVIGLWVNGAPLGYVSLATSLDGRTWTLNQPGFPAGSVVTMSIHGVMDITGNPLPDFSSQFTTVTPDTNAPTVVSQRPGNGATGVLSSSNLVLLVSEPLNPATVNLGSVHVTQNGLVVPGTVTLQDGSEIVFQPATAWAKGVQIAVQLDPTIQDLAGNALPTYQGLFTTQADPAVTPPSVVVASMGFGTTNAAFMLGYNEALNPATVTSSNVGMSLNCAGPTCIPMATVPTLDASGTVITLQPVDANGKPITLPPNFGTYYIWSTTGIQNTSGVAQSSLYYAYWSTGAGPDLSIPVVTSVTPSNGATGVGNNAQIVVRFSKPVAVATVTPLTVTLKNGTTTLIEGSMGFTGNGYHQELVVTPQGLLPDGATVTLTLSGITDEQGHPITPVTSSFVVGTGSDLVLPAVTLTNPIAGTIGIPTNQVIVLQVNKPIDPVTVNASTVYLAPTFAPSDHVAVTYTVSADGKTLTVSPTSRLMPGTSYVLTLAGPTDQVGNLLSSSLSFTTGIGTQTSPLQVLRASPGSGATGVPLNSLVDVQLSGPVNPGTIGAGSVSVTSGGVAVAGKLSLSADLTRLTFTPNGLLTAGANYLVTVAGFADAAGNAVVSYSTGFTAGSTSSLPAYSALSVVTWSPGSGSTGVSPTAPVVITFSSAVDPATVNAGTVFVQDLTAQFSSYGQGCCVPVKIPATITVNGNVVTLTPVTAWPGSATLQIAVAWTVTDLAGNSSIATGGYATSNFVTAVSTSVSVMPRPPRLGVAS